MGKSKNNNKLFSIEKKKIIGRIEQYLESNNISIRDVENEDELVNYLRKKYPEYQRRAHKIIRELLESAIVEIKSNGSTENNNSSDSSFEMDEDFNLVEAKDYNLINSYLYKKSTNQNSSNTISNINNNIKNNDYNSPSKKQKKKRKRSNTSDEIADRKPKKRKKLNNSSSVSTSSSSLIPASKNNRLHIPNAKYSDVGGIEHIIQDVRELIEWPLTHPEIYSHLGVNPPRGILLHGPPGCGKTLLARVTANEIKANFIWVKCPELITDDKTDVMAIIQQEVHRAKTLQPCIIFLEEFECIARVRTSDSCNSSDGMISHLAIILDSITASWESIFVFAATNRPDIIEPALLRPGRFDQLIYIPMPDSNAREEILKAALRKVSLEEGIDLKYLSLNTHGLSGADLKEICQRACKFAIRESIENNADMIVTKHHLELAMSYSRKSVCDRDVYRYEHFNKVLLQISSKYFKFPNQDNNNNNNNNNNNDDDNDNDNDLV